MNSGSSFGKADFKIRVILLKKMREDP